MWNMGQIEDVYSIIVEIYEHFCIVIFPNKFAINRD